MKITTVALSSIFGLFLMFSLTSSLAHAQEGASSSGTAQICVNLPSEIGEGSDDYSSQNTVTSLQNFLSDHGFFDRTFIGTGHFGPRTMRAVQDYQSAHNIPNTGYVGPLTRASINSNTCGTTTPPQIVPPQTSPVSIYSINPSSLATGATLNITGFGFTNNNTVLLNNNVAARNVPITSSIAIACTTNSTCHGGINQTLSIAVPSSLSPNCPTGSMCPMYMMLVTPGQYSVTVQNSNGTSNPATLTITGTNGIGSQTLSVTGLDAPSKLLPNQTGTWTVHALTSSTSGTLHYSVVWGDERNVATSIMAPTSYPVTTTSATFTHQYQNAGTYTPVFTVTDDAGHSATISNTVSVSNPLYY